MLIPREVLALGPAIMEEGTTRYDGGSGVQLTRDEQAGVSRAVATNGRHLLIIEWPEEHHTTLVKPELIPAVVPGFATIIPRAAIQAVRQTLNKLWRLGLPMLLSEGGGRLSLSHADPDAAGFTFAPLAGRFPDWMHVMKGALTERIRPTKTQAQQAVPISFDPRVLKTLADVLCDMGVDAVDMLIPVSQHASQQMVTFRCRYTDGRQVSVRGAVMPLERKEAHLEPVDDDVSLGKGE